MTKKKKIEYETCIICGKPTKVPANMHIDFRDYYVEGAGQCHAECYKKVFSSIE